MSKYNLWKDFDDCADFNGRFIDKVKATGYCMLDAVRLSVLYDCNKLITFDGLKAKITNKLLTDNAKHLDFHGKPGDKLAEEVLVFFEDPKFISSNACDLLLLVTADVLNLKIFIYQKNLADETIQVLPIPGENFNDEVHLMFTHNNLHPGGNHYDTVLLNADNRKMKHNGTLYSTATKVRKLNLQLSFLLQHKPRSNPNLQIKKKLFNRHLQKKQFLQGVMFLHTTKTWLGWKMFRSLI